MRRKLALFVAVLAFASGGVAWQHWNTGTPPTWSYFSERATAEVLVSVVVESAEEIGGRRKHARVDVAWPPGSAESQPLPGVEPVHVPKSVWTAEQIVRAYPVGGATSVRVVGSAPFADRTDMTEMAYAVFFSIASAGGLLLSGVLMRRPAAIETEEDDA